MSWYRIKVKHHPKKKRVTEYGFEGETPQISPEEATQPAQPQPETSVPAETPQDRQANKDLLINNLNVQIKGT